MPKRISKPPSNPLPANLAAPARRALEAAGYDSLRKLSKAGEDDLAALHGIGPGTLRTLRQALSEAGLALAKPAALSMKKVRFKPGDIYEDCHYHPCLCTAVSYREDCIHGISLIDGSAPRSCSLRYCGVIKLTPAQALLWKQKGPQHTDGHWQPLPDQQWWWPKAVCGINLGEMVDGLFRSSLLFLRNEAKAELPGPVVGWFDSSAEIDERARNPSARVAYSVRCEDTTAIVEVDAVKEGRLWPIKRIVLRRKGRRAVEFTGDRVRGCGWAN